MAQVGTKGKIMRSEKASMSVPVQAALIEGFAALGRALQPAIQAMNQFTERCIANRRMRLALMRGNVAQWNWYATEHLRRCQSN